MTTITRCECGEPQPHAPARYIGPGAVGIDSTTRTCPGVVSEGPDTIGDMTTATDTIPTAARPFHLECPNWCEDATEIHRDGFDWASRIHDGNDYYGPTLVRGHIGPRFGAFSCFGESDALTGEVAVWVKLDDLAARRQVDEGADLAGLRDLARDAQCAALWIEAQR